MSTELEKALSYLSDSERTTLDQIEKVIVWGYPLHTHTQSYLHACWEKVFKALGKQTFWFHDKEFADPAQFSYKNCMFIAEGYQDMNIPLESSSIYFINFCIYPQKYIRAGARLFELRFKVDEFHDTNNDWNLNDGTHTITKLSEDVLYEQLSSTVGIAPEVRGLSSVPLNYEAIYMQWPTDLLPWEIDFSWAELQHKPVVHHVGTPYGNPRFEKFQELIKQRGIEFVIHNPWAHPISFEDAREFVQESCLAPDFRPEGSPTDRAQYGEMNGKNHLAIGYIPCRLFKNISYGHIPLTDSPHAAEFFGDAVVFSKDIEDLIEKGLDAQKDIERKKRAMKLVADRHTYLHRARDLLRAIAMPRPQKTEPSPSLSTWNQITFVTSLININREQLDGRRFEEYVNWFMMTLRLPAPIVCFVEPGLTEMVRVARGSLPTKIIPQTFGQTPLAWSTPSIDQIQQSPEWKARAVHPNDLNNRSAPYVVLMHNKAAWMKNVIEENPFQTDLFFWMDGGLSRFWQNLDTTTTEPHPRFLTNLRRHKKIYAQIGGGKEEMVKRAFYGPKISPDEIIGTNQNVLMGGFWGGPKSVIVNLCEFLLRTYVNELLVKRRVDSDQPLLYLHLQQSPHQYSLVPPFPQIDIASFLIMAMGKVME